MKKHLLIIAAIVSINAIAQIPTNGLVAHYTFNGNANDTSGNSNNGVVTGATLTTDRFGNANSAYDFNGLTDLITFPQQFIFNQSGDATISIWLKSNTPTNNIQATFLKSNTNSQDANRFNFFLNNISASKMKLNLDYRETNTNIHILNIDSSFTMNNWQHIVFTRSGNDYNLYLNGHFVNTSTDVSPNLPTAVGWVLGNDPSGNSDFSGVIDDIRLYSNAVDSSGVSALYYEGICYQSITVTDTLIINANLTSYNPITYSNTIKVYPNPSKDHLYIDVDNNSTGYQINIINSLSQSVFQTTINQQQYYIDLNTWSGNGVYFIQVYNTQGSLIDIRKIVLQ